MQVSSHEGADTGCWEAHASRLSSSCSSSASARSRFVLGASLSIVGIARGSSSTGSPSGVMLPGGGAGCGVDVRHDFHRGNSGVARR